MDSESRDTPPEGRVAIVAVTRNGASLALRLQASLPGSDCFVPQRHRFALAMGAAGYERLGTLFPKVWAEYRAVICIMATGIVVRLIAPLLKHKTVDPAVVVLDERGNYAISLVSGHLGGANRLAKKVAGIIGGRAVITTASDVSEKPALDMIAAEAGLEIENVEMLGLLERAVLEDEAFWVFDPEGRLDAHLADQPNVFPLTGNGLTGRPTTGIAGTLDSKRASAREGQVPGIWVSETLAPGILQCLALRPRNLVVGIGCNRGTPVKELLDFLATVFEWRGLSMLSIRNLASVDLKADEPAILEAAKALRRPVRFYSRLEIENINVPNPSAVVAAHIGVESVCEATALLSAQTRTLLIPKQKTANVTLAVARVGFPS